MRNCAAPRNAQRSSGGAGSRERDSLSTTHSVLAQYSVLTRGSKGLRPRNKPSRAPLQRQAQVSSKTSHKFRFCGCRAEQDATVHWTQPTICLDIVTLGSTPVCETQLLISDPHFWGKKGASFHGPVVSIHNCMSVSFGGQTLGVPGSALTTATPGSARCTYLLLVPSEYSLCPSNNLAES